MEKQIEIKLILFWITKVLHKTLQKVASNSYRYIDSKLFAACYIFCSNEIILLPELFAILACDLTR